MVMFLFHGRVFGGLACLPKLHDNVWTATLGNILTMDNLRKLGLVGKNWCYLCKKNGESVDHLLLQCEVTSVVG